MTMILPVKPNTLPLYDTVPKYNELIAAKKSSRVTTKPASWEFAFNPTDTALTLNGAKEEARFPSSNIAIPANR